MTRALVVLLLLVAGVARAQPPDNAATSNEPRCGGSTALHRGEISSVPGYLPVAATSVTVQWTELAVEAAYPSRPLLDTPDVVAGLLAPAFERDRMATEPTRTEGLARAAADYGYQLTEVKIGEGGKATLRLVPLPLVRRVQVSVDQSLLDTLFDEEIRRRMVIKAGSYLPWWSDGRTCALVAERERIEGYLHDQGYYEASVDLSASEGGDGAIVRAKVKLGAPYRAKSQIILQGTRAEITGEQLEEIFSHKKHCLPLFSSICIGSYRYTAEQHQKDVEKVIKLYQKAGYPGVRIESELDRVEKDTKLVYFAVTIDPRRRVEVEFEGDRQHVTDEQLRPKLTFDTANSADDVEAANSARELAAYLQTRGYFDARVTWKRSRIPDTVDDQGNILFVGYDKIVFHLDVGPNREVKAVQFERDRAIDIGKPPESIVTTKVAKLSDTVFGTDRPATAAVLAADVIKLASAYKHAGYPDARVRVATATTQAGLDGAALSAALVAAGRGNDLYVRFTIDAGQPTRLTRLEIALDPDPNAKAGEADLCAQALEVIAAQLGDTQLKTRDPTAKGCAATAPNLLFKDDVVTASGPALRTYLANHGRRRASVDVKWQVTDHRASVRYEVHRTDSLTIGHVVIRGNFRTHGSFIRDEMKLRLGRPLTEDALADAERQIRGMGLFDAVNIDTPALCAGSEKECIAAGTAVDAIVRVQERYDYKAQAEVSAGYSSLSGEFITITPANKNLFGTGASLQLAGTYGSKIRDVEATLRIPRWLVRRPVRHIPLLGKVDPLEAEITAFYREQDTPNFGLVTTEGFTAAVSYAKATPRTQTSPAHTFTVGVHYDYRSRNRNIDTIRPVGGDNDSTQVPVTTDTGSIGVTADLDQRVDQRGGLAPLAPDTGYRLDGSVAIAQTWLGGQDDFVKVSASATRYWSLTESLILRADLRYDEGFPLGDAALLPEVERFFAGGDSTVRGYDDDRLKTELVEVGVPPFSGQTQLRVLPAGGNIRVMGSLDAQVRLLGKYLASGLFLDAGMITNDWSTVEIRDVKPAVGMSLLRVTTPFGVGAVEYAVPIYPELGDDPRGRFHLSFAARAQF